MKAEKEKAEKVKAEKEKVEKEKAEKEKAEKEKLYSKYTKDYLQELKFKNHFSYMDIEYISKFLNKTELIQFNHLNKYFSKMSFLKSKINPKLMEYKPS